MSLVNYLKHYGKRFLYCCDNALLYVSRRRNEQLTYMFPRNRCLAIKREGNSDGLKFIVSYWRKRSDAGRYRTVKPSLGNPLLAGKYLVIGGVLSSVAFCFTNKKGESYLIAQKLIDFIK